MAEPLKKELTTADLAGRMQERNREMRDIRDRDIRDNEVRDNIDTTEKVRPMPIRVGPGDDLQRDKPLPVAAAERTMPAGTAQIANAGTDDTATHLFSDSDVTDLRGRWSSVQTGFVDEPRHAVEEADKLVASVMERLAQGFASERSNLEKQWDKGDSVSTEDLRVAFRRYRTFFDRLLNA